MLLRPDRGLPAVSFRIPRKPGLTAKSRANSVSSPTFDDLLFHNVEEFKHH